jgi:serine phosphatase RsbU (regulator of sigma subunit)
LIRLTLRRKLLSLSIVLAIIPLLVTGWNMIVITQNELKSAANDELSTVVRIVSSEIDHSFISTWLTPLLLIRNAFDSDKMGVEEKISLFTGIDEIRDVAVLQLTVEGTPEPVMVVQDRFKEKMEAGGLEPVRELLLTWEQANSETGNPAKSGNKPYTSGGVKYFSPIDTWLFTVNIPLSNPINGRAAVLSAGINLNRLRDTINNLPFTKTGRIIIVDQEGKKMFEPGTPDMSGLKIVATALRILKTNVYTIGVFPYVRPGGEKMLGAFSFSMNFEWAVIAEKNEAAAYAAIREMESRLRLWVLLGLIVAIIGAVYVSRRISEPILGIGTVAEIVGMGNLDVKVKKLKSNDEISDLGRQINKMIDGLRDKTRLELFNKKLRDLNNQLTGKNEEIANVNLRLSERNEKISHQNEVIEQKNRMILSSINYACEIQNAIIPLEEDLNEAFPGHFVIYRPKDIVSGDFYWYYKQDDGQYIIAVADCTGHGVPGGFISMVGNLLLNKIVSEERVFEPGQILDRLDEQVKQFFKQESGKFQDGMDICLCHVDRPEGKLLFSGARRPLYVIKKTTSDEPEDLEIEVFKGTRKSIGGWRKRKSDMCFETLEFELDQLQQVYMTSDGFVDQCNSDSKRFGTRRFEGYIREIAHQSLENQEKILSGALKGWQEDEPQCDDITIIGIKL